MKNHETLLEEAYDAADAALVKASEVGTAIKDVAGTFADETAAATSGLTVKAKHGFSNFVHGAADLINSVVKKD